MPSRTKNATQIWPELVDGKINRVGITLLTSQNDKSRNNPEFPSRPTHVARRNLYCKDVHSPLRIFSCIIVVRNHTNDVEIKYNVMNKALEFEAVLTLRSSVTKYTEIMVKSFPNSSRRSQRHTTQPTLISPTHNSLRNLTSVLIGQICSLVILTNQNFWKKFILCVKAASRQRIDRLFHRRHDSLRRSI